MSTPYPQLNPRISHETAEWLKAYKAETGREGTKLVVALLDALRSYSEAHGGMPEHPFDFEVVCYLKTRDRRVIRPKEKITQGVFDSANATLNAKERRANRASGKASGTPPGRSEA